MGRALPRLGARVTLRRRDWLQAAFLDCDWKLNDAQ